MNIDELYQAAISGGKSEENVLFSNLTEIFLLFVRLKVRNEDDCQEIVQDVLMTISGKYRNMTYNIGFSAWAYGILKYRIVDYYRSKQAKESRFSRVENTDEFIGNIQLDPEFEQQLLKCLKNLHKMNPRYFRILNLRFQGFGIKEICGKLEMTANNIYVTLFRAREILKKCLQGVSTADE